MLYDMVKYERGQVWVIRMRKEEAVGHEIMKDRPWLILSTGNFNQSSGLLTCVPITTRDEERTPTQVKFKNSRGVYNVILCEQIRTFDYKSNEYLLDYLGTLPASIMDSVDVALSTHLGVHYSPITLKNLYTSMENIIKSVGYLQEKERTSKFTEDDVIDFALKLQELVTIPEDNLPEESSIESDVHSSQEDIDKSPRRIKWTPDVCQEFLSDCDKYPVDEILRMWNIPTRSKLYYMKHYARVKLSQDKE